MGHLLLPTSSSALLSLGPKSTQQNPRPSPSSATLSPLPLPSRPPFRSADILTPFTVPCSRPPCSRPVPSPLPKRPSASLARRPLPWTQTGGRSELSLGSRGRGLGPLRPSLSLPLLSSSRSLLLRVDAVAAEAQAQEQEGPDAPGGRSLVGDHPRLPPPFALDAVGVGERGISKGSMEQHVAHYYQCLEQLNRHLDADDTLKRLPLEELLKAVYNNGNPLPCFNSAAETWNHQFFWTSLNPEGGDACPPEGELAELLERDFGGLQGFKEQFKAAAKSAFGSGWVWLSAKPETLVPQEWLRDLEAHNPYRLCVSKLIVEKTSNALNPLIFDRIPLLALDMWEHAYLGDYGMDKEAYVDDFLNKLVSWDTVVARVENAKAYVNFVEMPSPKDSLFRPGFVGEYRLADAPITLEKAADALKGTIAQTGP